MKKKHLSFSLHTIVQSVPSGAAQGCYAVPTPHGAILQNGKYFYELTCDSSACSWTTKSYEASVSRNRGVLMWLPTSFAPECPEYETMFIFGRYALDDPRPAIYLDLESGLNCTVDNPITGMYSKDLVVHWQL